MITTFKDFIAINEMFSGGDRGYPFEKKPPEEHHSIHSIVHDYDVKLPDNVHDSGVRIIHEHKKRMGRARDYAGTAHVSFTMPASGYGMTPEAKETYHNAYNDHIKNSRPIGTRRDDHITARADYGTERDAHNVATAAVLKKHGAADAKLADDARSHGSTMYRSNESNHHNFSMFATVKKIMDAHGKAHPEIKHFGFSSVHDDPSRDRLYDNLTRMHGGTTHLDFTGERQYLIPNPHYIPKRKRKPL